MNTEDFMSVDPIEKEICGRMFKLKPLTGWESDEILDKDIKITDGKVEICLSIRNSEWLTKCVLDAPYEKDGKPFKELLPEDRLGLLQKLKPKIRLAIIKELSEMNEGTEEEKKT